jgi:hypothetical protein
MSEPSRRRTVGSLLVVGGGLVLLGATNVWIGRDKGGDYTETIARLERSVAAGTDDASPREVENARGKHAFYLGVEQAGWWLAAGGFGLGAIGLGVAWIESRGR